MRVGTNHNLSNGIICKLCRLKVLQQWHWQCGVGDKLGNSCADGESRVVNLFKKATRKGVNEIET